MEQTLKVTNSWCILTDDPGGVHEWQRVEGLMAQPDGRVPIPLPRASQLEPRDLTPAPSTSRSYTADVQDKWRTLATVSFGTFLVAMDMGLVNFALPTFSRVFDAPPDTVLWATLAGSLAGTGLT